MLWLPISGVVSDTINGGSWWIDGTRSRNPIISLLRQCLPSSTPIALSSSDDSYRWKIGTDVIPKDFFSSSVTWHALHPWGPPVGWAKAVWFKSRIPKHAFLCWVSARNHMHTRDRLRLWGIAVPPGCLMCDAADETGQHIFFDCAFSHEIWHTFNSAANVTPPTDFDLCLLWLKSPSRDANKSLILRLAFQASLYGIWRERNARLHNASSTPASTIITEIKKRIRCRLDPLSSAQPNTPSSVSFLASWFSKFSTSCPSRSLG
ncbi:uncharacterized protein LOC112082062 [Eutrema salsugineum]|uniref:uncharacterized protein LOC112082062 n=1 Tax=Eutrema salsugineum TaxID=72664 RepID=UPI000CED576B|nr:uncharacterized protein LOC112082062 [Eutrema salsugineum]